jgi:Polysaccharide deacetylase
VAISALSTMMQLTGQVSAALRKPRVQVLLLHHVFPDEERGFRRLLESLSRRHTFISYSEAVRRIDDGEINRPYIALTFDDGFKNCMRAAAVMKEFDALGCFFICPSIIGEHDSRKLETFCRERLLLPNKPVEFMSWSDLESLRAQGHDIGGHTMTHANLARIPPAQAEDEIAGSFEAIKSKLGDVEHFAWTFGRFADFTPDAARFVYQAGYSSCASGVRGCHPPTIPDHSAPTAEFIPVCIRRDHVLAGAPLKQARYFLAQSSRKRAVEDHGWPADWLPPPPLLQSQ